LKKQKSGDKAKIPVTGIATDKIENLLTVITVPIFQAAVIPG
jgi:hypothetical protein